MIIIDEIFDACSEENKPMAIKLLEYYKTQYNKILLVSHNQSIINSFDSRIKIKRDDLVSTDTHISENFDFASIVCANTSFKLPVTLHR